MLAHVLAVEHLEVPPLVVDALEAAAVRTLRSSSRLRVLRGRQLAAGQVLASSTGCDSSVISS
jgi:hypothetical protein